MYQDLDVYVHAGGHGDIWGIRAAKSQRARPWQRQGTSRGEQ